MGDIVSTTPMGILVAGVLYQNEDLFVDAGLHLTGRYGPFSVTGEPFDFTMTRYYETEMGGGLFKRFIAFERPVKVDDLPAIKRFTNDVEDRYAVESSDGVSRRINIDPGYVTLSKLVLASTKDYSHRVYIGGGIFAETTLRYRGGTFHATETTYPDYSQPTSIAFFNTVRDYAKRIRDTWTRDLKSMN